MLRKMLLALGLALLLAAGIGLAWGWRPPTETTISLKLSPSQMTLPGAAGGAPAPGIQAARQVTLTYPSRLRLGESSIIRLAFAPLADETSAAAGPDVTLTHNALADARLEMAVLPVGPYPQIIQPLQAERPAVFEWNVAAEQTGDFEGYAWLYLGFVPKDGGPQEERALSAQPVNLHVESLLGLGIVPVRLLAPSLLVIGATLLLFALLRKHKS